MSVRQQSHLAVEVASQPDRWEQVIGRVEQFRPALPEPGAAVAVLGCGSSSYVAQAYAALREQRGDGVTDAFPASEHRLARGYDHALVVTRSGTTTEALAALRDARSLGIRTTVIVAAAGSPAIGLADAAVLLPEADEQSVVQSRCVTAVLALLRTSLGEDLRPAISQARALLADPAAAVSAELEQAEQLTFLGRGWTVGLAFEAALKLRESAQVWAEAYPAMEYRHGPISIAGPGRAVWPFGPLPPGLADQILATGARLEQHDDDPLVELVRVHLLCLARAERAGLDPDRPRHLTRSIILDASGHAG